MSRPFCQLGPSKGHKSPNIYLCSHWFTTGPAASFPLPVYMTFLPCTTYGGGHFLRRTKLHEAHDKVNNINNIKWCSFCRLKPAKRTPPNINRNKSSNTQRTENKTTDVVIHQHSRKLLKMDILMSETLWAHNKWNKIASDIKLVFHSSIIAWLLGRGGGLRNQNQANQDTRPTHLVDDDSTA